MYNLPRHKENDPKVIREFIAQYPFAFVTGCDAENEPVATQVPVFIEEHAGREVLRGHMMKDTDHHKAFLQNENVLAVFHGPHTYVSGTWYSDPHTPSTWNYMSVHVRGVMKFLDAAALENVLRKTTLHFENGNPLSATTFDNIPEKLKRRLMHMIVAFEVEIAEIKTVFKLSQDRDAQSYENIIGKLKQQDEAGQAIAYEMEKRYSLVFPQDDSRDDKES